MYLPSNIEKSASTASYIFFLNAAYFLWLFVLTLFPNKSFIFMLMNKRFSYR